MCSPALFACPQCVARRCFRAGICIATQVQARAASTNGAAAGFELEISWEDAVDDEEETGYVRVSDVTVLQRKVVHKPRVRDLAELRQNVSSRQQQRHRRALGDQPFSRHRGENMADPVEDSVLPPTKQRIAGRSGRTNRHQRSTGAGASGRSEPLGREDSPPWWLERASMLSDLPLPALNDRSASTGGATSVACRKHKQQPRPRTRTREPPVLFRPNTPLHDRLTALKEHALTKKIHATADGHTPTKDWPSALLRHYYVHGDSMETWKTCAVARELAVSEKGDSSVAITNDELPD